VGAGVGAGAGAAGASSGTGTGTQSDSEKSLGKMFKRSCNPIRAFLQHHSPCDKCDLGVREEVMKRFMKSCAGYSVITYILGDLRTYPHSVLKFYQCR
jgi:phosphatidylinositol 3-kinase